MKREKEKGGQKMNVRCVCHLRRWYQYRVLFHEGEPHKTRLSHVQTIVVLLP